MDSSLQTPKTPVASVPAGRGASPVSARFAPRRSAPSLPLDLAARSVKVHDLCVCAFPPTSRWAPSRSAAFRPFLMLLWRIRAPEDLSLLQNCSLSPTFSGKGLRTEWLPSRRAGAIFQALKPLPDSVPSGYFILFYVDILVLKCTCALES